MLNTSSLQQTAKFCLLLLSVLLLSSSTTSAKIIDRILAVVNGEIVTQYELQQYLKLANGLGQESPYPPEMMQDEQFTLQVLDQMINEILVEQEAERFQLEVSQSDVEAYIDRYKSDNDLTDAEFLKALEKQGLSLKDFTEKITRDIKKNQVLNNMIRQKVVVTEEEERRYYENHQDQFKQAKQVRLRLLLVSDKKLLEELRRAIARGSMTFAQAAQKHSIGPGAEQGGDMGLLDWKDLGQEWKKALSELEEKELSSIFALQNHYALLYLESVQTEKSVPFEQARGSIRQLLYSEKLNARFHEYISQLRSKAVLDIRL